MMETGEIRQGTTAVHDVLSLFRDKTVHDVMNPDMYVVRTGCQWRMLPTNLPPWQTVYGYFRRWKKNGLWERIHEALVKKVRVKHGRKP